jgi:hypothetical protein
MALDFTTEEANAHTEGTPAAESTDLSSDDILAPSCMFWAMIIGLVFFGGSIVLWIIENIGRIGQ